MRSITRIIITIVGLLASVNLTADQVISVDQIIRDDLISPVIGGRLCVGLDCIPCNDSLVPPFPTQIICGVDKPDVFDAETVRLQENNLRIRFHDTSITGDTFGQSWSISANDKLNGDDAYIQSLGGSDAYMSFELKSLFPEGTPLSDGTAPLYDCTTDFSACLMQNPQACPIVGTIPVGEQATDALCTLLPAPPLPAPLSDGTAPLYDCTVLTACDQISFPIVCPIVGTIPVGEPVTDSACQPLLPQPAPYTVKSMLKLIADNIRTDMAVEDGVTIGYESEKVNGAVSVGRTDLARRIANVAAGMGNTNILITQVLNDYVPFEQQVAAVDDLNQQLDAIGIELDDIDAIIALLENPPVEDPPVEDPPVEDPPVGSGSSGNCFVATAAYGSYLEPEVRLLRDFRDRYLLTNVPGRAFVDWYYRTSPPVADVIAERGLLRLMTRLALTPMVYGIKYPAAAGLTMLVMLIAPVGRMRRRKAV